MDSSYYIFENQGTFYGNLMSTNEKKKDVNVLIIWPLMYLLINDL